MKLSLVVLSGKPEGKEIPIRLTQFLIGRDADCHLRPASPLISKRHCAILQREDKAFIRDFGSTNGTLVNQRQLQGECELQDGDMLKIGPLSFQVKITPEPEAAPVKAPEKDANKETLSDEAGNTLVAEKTTTGGTKPMPAMGTPARKGASAEEDLIADLLFDGNEPPGGGSPSDIPMGTTVMAMMGTEETPPEEADAAAPKDTRVKQKIADNKATADAAKAILEKYMRRPRT